MLLRLLTSALLMVVLIACGGAAPDVPADSTATAGAATEPPDADAAASDGDAPGGAGLAEVYAELEGLQGEEREARLVELAQQEEGPLSLYTAMNLDNFRPLADDFTSMHGVDVDIYRAGADAVSQRFTQEVMAGVLS